MRFCTKKLFLWLLLFLLVLPGMAITAEFQARNPIEWLGELECKVVGQNATGNLMERLDNLEQLLTGRIRQESIVDRLIRLDNLVYTNQPHGISLLYKIKALEWVLYHEVNSDPILTRLGKMEVLLFGQNYSGAVTKRVEKLISQVFPGGTVRGRWASIPEGQLIRVKLGNELSSVKSKAGDRFSFMVAETVTNQGLVLFPQGTTGEGYLKRVKRPGNLGRNARLLLNFSEIKAMDGTAVSIFSGSKASEENRSYNLAFGASAAGMLVLGPEGILMGLAVKGKEMTIPAGTEFFLQVKEAVRIYTLDDDRR